MGHHYLTKIAEAFRTAPRLRRYHLRPNTKYSSRTKEPLHLEAGTGYLMVFLASVLDSEELLLTLFLRDDWEHDPPDEDGLLDYRAISVICPIAAAVEFGQTLEEEIEAAECLCDEEVPPA